jgi:hypothetical protein
MGLIQAHNHNYQRFLIDNVSYFVIGTGMHDNGPRLYGIKSTDFNGHRLLKGIDDQNGIAIIDLSTGIKQWFIDNSEKVLDIVYEVIIFDLNLIINYTTVPYYISRSNTA